MDPLLSGLNATTTSDGNVDPFAIPAPVGSDPASRGGSLSGGMVTTGPLSGAPPLSQPQPPVVPSSLSGMLPPVTTGAPTPPAQPNITSTLSGGTAGTLSQGGALPSNPLSQPPLSSTPYGSQISATASPDLLQMGGTVPEQRASAADDNLFGDDDIWGTVPASNPVPEPVSTIPTMDSSNLAYGSVPAPGGTAPSFPPDRREPALDSYVVVPNATPTQPAAQPPVYEEQTEDPAQAALLALVRSARRQEELYEKVCGLLSNLNEKFESFSTSTGEKLEHFATTTQRLEYAIASIQPGSVATVPLSAVAPASAPVPPRADVPGGIQRGLIPPPGQRGAIIQPPGREPPRSIGDPRLNAGAVLPRTTNPLAPGGVNHAEAERVKQQAILEQQRRLEEEERERQEQVRLRLIEEEARRKREEEERKLEEQRLAALERAKKEALDSRTKGLMSNLMTGTGPDLFPDEPKRPDQAKGLFDD